MGANQESIIKTEVHSREHRAHDIERDLKLSLIQVRIRLDNPVRLRFRHHEGHKDDSISRLDRVQPPAPCRNGMDWLCQVTDMLFHLVHLND